MIFFKAKEQLEAESLANEKRAQEALAAKEKSTQVNFKKRLI